MNAAFSGRRHDIDALRVFAFGMLILYHVGMFYVAQWDFHLKSAYQFEWLQLPMVIVNRWRMPLIFLISGLAVHFLWRRAMSTARFAAKRTTRLLIPLAFGMAFVVPIQPYLQTLSQGLIEPGFGDFLVRYWSGRGFPEGAYGGWEHGWTWNHLWYLPYLLVYTLLTSALFRAFESPLGLRLRSRVTALRGASLLFIPALPFILGSWALQSRFPETHDLFNDWHAHAVYFTSFLYGYFIGGDKGLWSELSRLRWKSLWAALTILAIYLFVSRVVLPDEPTQLQLFFARPLRWFYMWMVLVTILGWACTHLNRPFRWLPYATNAVYPWYVLHQSLIIALGYWLSGFALGPVAEPLLVLAGTIVGCLAIHHLIVRNLGPLGFLFGAQAPPAIRRPDAVAPRVSAG